jgi:hypothetical protein
MIALNGVAKSFGARRVLDSIDLSLGAGETVGRIYLDDLHDPAHAAEAFELLADDYPSSVLRDDALYDLARARREQHDLPAACRALARLIKQFPDGNRVRVAQALQQELACAGAPAVQP